MVEKPLKYHEIIKEQNLDSNCPFSDCYEANLTAYRWVKLPIEDEDNFLPKLILDRKHNKPPRRNNSDDKTICSDCALSMFDDKDKATKKFNKYPKRTRNLLGYSHVAKGEIAQSDGVITQISNSGHFDLFEYENVSLKHKFIISGELNHA